MGVVVAAAGCSPSAGEGKVPQIPDPGSSLAQSGGCATVVAQDHPTVALDKRNLARLHVFGKRCSSFEVLVDHWPFWSGEARLDRAKLVSGYGRSATPLLLVGDRNETVSGPLLP